MKDVVLADNLLSVEEYLKHASIDENIVLRHLNIIRELILGDEGKAIEIKTRDMILAWRPIREEVVQLVRKGEIKKAVQITQGKGADHEFKLEQQMLVLNQYALAKADVFLQNSLKTEKRLLLSTGIAVVLGTILSIFIAFLTTKHIMSSLQLRKKAEEDLKSINDKVTEQFSELENIYQSTPLGLCFINKDLCFVRVNETMAEINGKSVSAHLGKSIEDVIPELASMIIPIYKNVIETGEPAIDFGIHGVTAANPKAERDWLVSYYPVKNDKGDVLGVNTIVTDITDRKQAETELKKSEERFRDIARSSGDWFWEVDQYGRYTFASGKVQKVLGYTPEELIGKTPFDFMPPNVANNLKKIFKELVAAKKPIVDLENINLSKDGKVVYLVTNGIPIFNESGELEGYRGADKDFTYRKKVEKEFEDLFNLSQDLMCISSLDGEIFKVNPSWEKTLGYTSAEIIELGWKKLVHPADLEPVDKKIEKQLKGEPVLDFVNRYRCKDGTYRTLEWKSFPSEDGKVYATARDITERKKVEEEKIKLEEQLRQAIKMQAVGTLAGGIAHEFNNLLGVIMGCADMARDEIDKGSFARIQLDKVMEASHRVKDLVKQILTFSRKSQQNKISVDFCSLVKESIKLIQSSIPSSVRITISIDSACGNVTVDPTEVQQIILNLCSNAVCAMNERGELSIRLTKVHLVNHDELISKGLTAGNYAKLSFSDTGCGMDQATCSQIFDPFFTTKEVGQGTGMGLSIVYGIIESYSGIITVESEVGKGATFHLYFPVRKKLAAEKYLKIETIPKGNERILFVDDEEMYGDMGKDMLTHLGYEVILKKSSSSALEVFKAAPDNYDIIITDQVMPDLSGDELAKEIRLIRTDMPIILCTGYSSQMDPEKASILGVNAFVFKPFAKLEIAKLIRKVLDVIDVSIIK